MMTTTTEEEEEVDLVNFQGAMNDRTADMAANTRLVQVALRPTKDLVTEGIERRGEMMRMDIKGDRRPRSPSPSMACLSAGGGREWRNRRPPPSFRC